MKEQSQTAHFDSVSFETVETSMDVVIKVTDMAAHRLEPHDIASWAAFLPTVRVGGALPVTFRVAGAYVVAEVIVPYVAPPPPPREPELKLFIDNHAGDAGGKIPFVIAEGFPIPLAARYRLPRYAPDTAVHFLRQIVREIYQHEIDEQLRVGDVRPFAPEH